MGSQAPSTDRGASSAPARSGRHPWLTRDPARADVIVIVGHGLDRWCVAQTVLRNRLLEAQTSYHASELRSGALQVRHAGSCGGANDQHPAACQRAVVAAAIVTCTTQVRCYTACLRLTLSRE